MRSATVVLAAGGPGELFRDSVYPKRCFGSLGLALEAGIATVNLTEHQFGIGTRRDEFPGIFPAPTCRACLISTR
jgi:succinate dehydrogenase/fumarate reductase flavoprotein subunit